VKEQFLLKSIGYFEFLRLGVPKLRDLTNLWSYKLIIT